MISANAVIAELERSEDGVGLQRIRNVLRALSTNVVGAEVERSEDGVALQRIRKMPRALITNRDVKEVERRELRVIQAQALTERCNGHI
jgi:hypothetical protein